MAGLNDCSTASEGTNGAIATGPPMFKSLPITGPTINNIVCGANLNINLQSHLSYIALHARNASYNPKRFKAVILRIRSPACTGITFESGKLQILGTKSIADAKLAARKFARIVQKMGFTPRLDMSGFNVQNIVAHADTKMLIRLEGLAVDHYHFCRYEPEMFPGLVYNLTKPKITALVFAKGKAVLLGAKCREDVDGAMGLLYPVLVQYRRVLGTETLLQPIVETV